jgi:GDP/UDP-N,N'-diacetylbacillosamine 2-epimerase (hydrolysing)
MINDFVATHINARSFTTLGQLRYLSCIAQMDVVIGNSSSGLIEVPSFKKPTINIGDRQLGRVKAASVIDCEPSKSSILAALQKAYSPEFQAILATIKNPYSNDETCQKIIDILATVNLDNILKKHFFDIPR